MVNIRKHVEAVIGVVICVGSLSCSGGGAPGTTTAGQKPVEIATPKANFSLPCDGGTFSRVRLKNTKARTFEPDSFSGRSCTLTDKAEGVIWVATGEGHALQDAEKKLSFRDDQGRQFGHTCWTSSGMINGITQTELILFGPADSRKITVSCGTASADADIQ
jgi:hypothetical protein